MKRFNFLNLSFVIIILLTIATSMAYLLSESIRLDEAQSLWVAVRSVKDLLRISALDVHVPLYFLLLHYWVQIFGTEIMAARLLSLLFFVLTLPVLYTLVREVSTKSIALLTVALFTISPFVMWYSSEARMYTLFAFVTTLQHLTFLRLLRSNGRHGKFWYVGATVLGFYTHYFFNFQLLTQAIYVIGSYFYAISHDPNYREQKIRVLLWKYKGFGLRFLQCIIAAVLLFTPWMWFVVSSGSASNTQPLISPPTSYNIFAAFTNFMFGFQNNSVQAFIVSLWPLTLVILFLVFTKRQRAAASFLPYFVLMTFLPIAMVFMVSYFRPIFLARYLILVTPTLFFVLAWSFASYSRQISRFLVSTFLLVMFGLLMYQNSSASTPVKEDYKSVSAYLDKQAESRDIIAVSAPFTVYPIEYYYNGAAGVTTVPTWNRFSESDNTIQPFTSANFEKQIQNFKLRYIRVYLVLSYDQGYEQKIRQYMDSNFEMQKSTKFSPGLEVRTYVLRYDVKE